jgi:hypothetical protein
MTGYRRQITEPSHFGFGISELIIISKAKPRNQGPEAGTKEK